MKVVFFVLCGYIIVNDIPFKYLGDGMEHRKYPRLNATGMEVSIADRVGFSTGTIKDISRFGVCITDLPRQLQPANNNITVVISAKDKQFKLNLMPQWVKQAGLTMATGAIIDEVPKDWAEMVMQLERQNNSVRASQSFVTPRRRGSIKTLRKGVAVLKRAPKVVNQ